MGHHGGQRSEIGGRKSEKRKIRREEGDTVGGRKWEIGVRKEKKGKRLKTEI
jgi:hypothetical protein